MPVPSPNGGESEQDFTQRCMSNDKMVSDFPDEKQRYAVCMSSWREKKNDETIEEAVKNIAQKLT